MRKLIISISSFLLLSVFGDHLLAQERVYSRMIPDPPLVFAPNTTVTAEDDVYADPALRSLIGPVKKMQNVVILRINEESPEFIPSDFSVDVELDITKTPISGGAPVTVTKTLHLSYRLGMAQKSDAASYFVTDDGGYRLSVQIKTINTNVVWDVTKVLQVIAETHSLYDAPFDYASPITSLTDNNPSNASGTTPFDELLVSWSYPGNQGGTFNSFPTHYDLEWAWVETSSEEEFKTNGNWDPAKIFFSNTSRVTLPISFNSYKIPLFYDGSGRIFYRVRALQTKTDGQVVNGSWTTSLATQAGMYQMANGHEETLNWQVSTSYAEEGKRKTVIQYFDGSLRGRQTVTKDNSQPSPTTVVAETFYDYQGRPTIQVLPAPTLNNVINFTRNFNNNNIDHVGYPKEIYGLLQSGQPICGSGAPALDKAAGANNTLGAGNYYSSQNPLVNTGFNKFIPDANGFAFSETRYVQDGSGRIAAQSGVGEAHRLGTGHETQYFYSSPTQDEIDLLFGTDAGIASHYQKNMVRDANGQYSVSYVDMHGRTVATALAGPKPASLEKLKSLQDLENASLPAVKKQLLDEETNVVDGRNIVMVKELLVTSPGIRHFEYRLDPKQLLLQNCAEQNICYDCLYDLTITITNSCNNKGLPGEVPYVISQKNFTLPYNSVCGTDPQNIEVDFDVNFTEPGSYTITKTLTLSKDAQDQFRDQAMQYGNLVCKTYEEIEEEIRTVMLQQNANCQPTCASCTAALGTYGDFKENFRIRADLTPDQMPAYETELDKAYKQAKADCDAICENGSDRVNNYRDIMLFDVTPDRGQYARIMRDDLVDANGNPLPPVDISKRPENIFYGDKYRNPRDESGNPDQYKDELGVIDPTAQGLNAWLPPQFTDKFKESWANQLLYYHPEFGKLKLVESDVFKTAYNWQEEWQEKQKWSEVSAMVVGLPVSDPLRFAIPTFQSDMQTKMGNFMTITPPGQSSFTVGMWQFAIASLKCKDVESGSQVSCLQGCTNTVGSFPAEISCEADRDMVWRVFSSLYFKEREVFIYKYLQQAAPVNESLFAPPSNQNYIQYQARFINPESAGILTYLPSELNDLFDAAMDTDPNHVSGNQATANAALEAQFEDNCRSYAVQWLEKLKVFDMCKGSAISSTVYNALIEQLVSICKRGSDLDHPLGSSSASPANTSSTDPNSFEEAINNFMNANSITISQQCNPYIIDWPKPYEHSPSLGNEQIIESKPESCVCEKVTAVKALYDAAIGASTFAGSFSQFMQTRYGTVISDATLNQLVSSCNSPEPSCKFLAEPIILPPALQCGASNQICIDCNQYNALKSQFLDIFSQAIPSEIAVPVASPGSDLDLSWNKTFADFMNYYTGFAKQWHEYVAFEKGCAYSTEPINTPNGVCVRMNTHIEAFNSNFEQLNDGATDCRTLFTLYFNEHENTSFTYEQIKYIYNRCNSGSCNEVPLSCGQASKTISSTITGDDVFALRIDASGNAGNCSGTNTTELSVVVPSVTQPASSIVVLGSVATIAPSITIGVTDFVPDISTNCTDGTNYFQKTYGGNDNEMVYHSVAMPDGGVIIAGETNSYGNGAADGLLMKIDASGNRIWSKAFGGANKEVLYSLKPTADNGIISCGQTKSYGNGAGDALMIKTDVAGNVEWSKKYGDGNTYGDVAYDVVQLSDGGYAFCGMHVFTAGLSEIFVVRTNSQGDTIWSRKYGRNGIYSDNAGGILEDGNAIVVSGYTQGASRYDGYLMKLDKANGNILSQYGYDGENRTTWFGKINKTTDGYQVYSLLTDDWGGLNQQPCVWNIYTNGSIHNVRKLVIPTLPDFGYGWQTLADGGFVVSTAVNSSSSDPIISKVNAAGTLEWSKKFVLDGSQLINSIVPMPDGGYAGIGTSDLRSITPPVCGDAPAMYLCGLNDPVNPTLEIEPDDPCNDINQLVLHATTEAWTLYLQTVKDDFDKKYQEKCLVVKDIESLTVEAANEKEYHYTLYYYDQSGNLVQTVPPAGVDNFDNNATLRDQFLTNVKTDRQNGIARRPAHTLLTVYRYNTLSQVVQQKSPDGGLSKFWYDELGRLVVSQNAKQAAADKYSYTIYDELGRISQVGQKPTTETISQTITRDKDELQRWLDRVDNIGSVKEQITRTTYDVYYYNGQGQPALEPLFTQRNLRNRVSYTQVVPVEPGDFKTNDNAWVQAHSAATFYTYDIHGNVDEVLQDYNQGPMKDVANGANRFKKMAYTYDLISGKVNTVSYQPDYYDVNGVVQHHIDRFYHRYDYDAENKLTATQTSHDGIIWETDARYSYYKHGPLARTVLGQQQVQGIDYAYTLQGWVKGVNGTAISAAPTENCAPGTARDVLDVYNREQYGHPSVYTARQAINFHPEFFSDNLDDFTTNIDPNISPCVPVIAPNPYITGDMGEDGRPIGGNSNRWVARDAFSFSLNYYAANIGGQEVKDYASINSLVQPFAGGMFNITNIDAGIVAKPLFNGNIASMFVNIPKLGDAHLYGYQYDQLNRIVSMDAFKGFVPVQNGWETNGPVASQNYKERITYDPNGNILTYFRNGSTTPPSGGGPAGQQTMDQLTYQYSKDPGTGKILNNRLRYVHDQVDKDNYTEDIDSETPLSLAQVQAEQLPEQSGDNYGYDEIGNLVKDVKEGITNITWSVYGKILSITKNGNLISYTYDASRNRFSKTANGKTTIYVRDASGNVMAIYEKGNSEINNGNLSQTEAHLYGGSRLGIYSLKRNVENPAINTNGIYGFERGNKIFELSNHLGNVLVTVNDKKISIDSDSDGDIDYYEADVISANDYLVGGMIMPGRMYSSSGSYRYGFNGQEKSTEIDPNGNSMTAEFWQYDARLGRRWNVDPVVKEYESPYAAFSNNPIWLVDINGADTSITQKSITATVDRLGSYQNYSNLLSEHINLTKQRIAYEKSKYLETLAVETIGSFTIPGLVGGLLFEGFNGGKSASDGWGELLASDITRLNNLVTEFNSYESYYRNAVTVLKGNLENAKTLTLDNGIKLDNLSMAGVLATGVHKNSKNFVGDWKIYEILVDGKTYKFGIADATRLRKGGEFAELPERLAQQLVKIQGLATKAGVKLDVTYTISKPLLQMMKAKALEIEGSAIRTFAAMNGVPLGNAKEIAKWAGEFGLSGLSAKAIKALKPLLKLPK